jgi:IS30 family transposase
MRRIMKPHEAIEALLAAGETETAIAKAVGVSQSTINRIRHRGHSPRFDLGAALIKLAEARKGRRKSKRATSCAIAPEQESGKGAA